MSRKVILLIVVLLLAACGIMAACGVGALALSLFSVSPAEPSVDGSVPDRSTRPPAAQAEGTIAWEKLLTQRTDDPALADLEWSSSGGTVYNTAAGYTLDFDNTGQVSQLTLYAGIEGRRFAQYRGELPYGLVWGDTINSVADRLGSPDWVGPGLHQTWSAGSLGPYEIELSYYDGKHHDDIGDTQVSAIFIFP